MVLSELFGYASGDRGSGDEEEGNKTIAIQVTTTLDRLGFSVGDENFEIRGWWWWRRWGL